MTEPITRNTYLQRVGIHSATLTEWIADGIVTPRPGRGWRQTFTEEDVMLGRKLKIMIEKHRGKYSRKQMVEIVEGKRGLADRHSPPGAPPPVE